MNLPPNAASMPPSAPSFNAAERLLLQELMAAAEFIPVRMSTFLQQHFFNAAAGRALILQPPRRFGCYYLTPQVFSQPERLALEMKALLELFTLIARLRAHRLIYLFPPGSQAQEDMLFLSDSFDHPKPSTAHVVLNDKGDYTFQPECIQDAKDQVIYRGMRLDGEVYELIHDQVQGIVCLSDEFRSLMTRAGARPRAPAPAWPSTTSGLGPAPPAEAGTAAPPIAPGHAPATPSPADMASRRRAAWGVGAMVLAAGLGAAGMGGWHAHQDRRAGRVPGAVAPPVADLASAPASAGPASNAASPRPAAPAPAVVAAPAPPAEPVLGFDISKWNGEAGGDAVIDDAGAAFVFARASHGLSPDPSFARNWQRMAARALTRGAYHFYAMQDDPIAQAQHFLHVVGTPRPQDLCPTVDFEEASLPSRGVTPPVAEVQDALLAHLAHLEQHAGCVPMVYTNVAMGNRYLDDARFARYPLWIADWRTKQAQPELPRAWTSVGYRFWQRSAGQAFSTSPPLAADLDVFAGTKAQLLALRRHVAGPAKAASK